ncbi:MAG: cytochrome c [Acidobacteriia bacterium]|nr:cytochrome c [Terriglobia bacterium]
MLHPTHLTDCSPAGLGRELLNPVPPAHLAGGPAGAKLFRRHCVSCHGEDATGKGNKPSLRSEHVRNAAPGELQWLLTNGSMKNGMPSWSRLPEPQRWQLVSYLKSLN